MSYGKNHHPLVIGNISDVHILIDRGSEREDFFQPDSARRHRHRHRRSHSDSNDWPAVEDYGLLHQQHEPSPGLGRRQSYSGYPAAMASDLSPNSFEKTSGAYDDLRHSDERMHEARGQRRDSFPVAKVRFDSPEHCLEYHAFLESLYLRCFEFPCFPVLFNVLPFDVIINLASYLLVSIPSLSVCVSICDV